jgi:hypothetical protein
MVRSFTGLAVRSCQDEFVRRVLFGLFDHVDNTELVNQIIGREIANNIAELIYNKNGKLICIKIIKNVILICSNLGSPLFGASSRHSSHWQGTF